MTWLAPVWLAVGGLAAVGVVALHFITTQRPPAAVLPTARFVPSGKARAAARARRPTDVVLMMMRAGAVMLIAAAFARPVVRGGSVGLARVVIVDAIGGGRRAARDSALRIARAGDEIIGDTVEGGGRRAAGGISAGIVEARRVAARLAMKADSIELVIVSAFTGDEIDAATVELVGRWPGRVRVVRSAADAEAVGAVSFAGGVGDDWMRPVVAVVNAAAPVGVARVPVRVVRIGLSAGDSAAAVAGAAVVVWPVSGGAAGAARGVWAAGATLVAPLVAMELPVDSAARVVARWADGSPAATERVLGAGCVRSIGVGVPEAGDVALQTAFGGLAARMLAPCGAAMGGGRRAASDSAVAALAKGGGAATAASFIEGAGQSLLAAALAGAGMLLLIGEMWVRRAASGERRA